MNRLIIIIAIFAFAISSCNKDEDTPSKTEKILTSGKWYKDSLTVVSSYGGVIISQEELSDCQKDDYFEFKSKKTLIWTGGTEKCGNSEESTISGTWKLSNGDKNLNMNFGSTTVDYSILGCFDNKIRLTSNSSSAGASISITMVIIKK